MQALAWIFLAVCWLIPGRQHRHARQLLAERRAGRAAERWYRERGMLLALAFFLAALPAGAQTSDARRFRIEEHVRHPQACWVGRPCVLIDVSAGDPYRHLPANEAAFGAAFRSRYGLDEGQWRSQATCSWAVGEWAIPSARAIVRSLVGDPTYIPLTVESIDVTAACKQLDGIARTLRLPPAYSPPPSSGGVCRFEGWLAGPLPWSREETTNLLDPAGYAGYAPACCGYEQRSGVMRRLRRYAVDDPRCFGEVEPPPPPPTPPPTSTCDGGRPNGDCSEIEFVTGACPEDCDSSPPPGGCEPPASLVAAVAELRRVAELPSTARRLGERFAAVFAQFLREWEAWSCTPGPPSTGGLDTVLEDGPRRSEQ